MTTKVVEHCTNVCESISKWIRRWRWSFVALAVILLSRCGTKVVEVPGKSVPRPAQAELVNR